MTTIKASLKAVKKATVSPSKVEIILSDSVKIALAPIVSLFASSYQFGIEHKNLTLSKGKSDIKACEGFVNYIKANALDYLHMQAVKKHTIQSIASAKKQAYDTIEKWFNLIVKNYLGDADLKGFIMPKAESKNAVSMGKLRAELSSIDNETLSSTIETLAKQGDKESLKKAMQLATEREKRATQEVNRIKQSDSKASTELKTLLKKWVTGMSSLELATLVYVKNNFNMIEKQALTKSQ